METTTIKTQNVKGIEQRFWSKVDFITNTPCWTWKAAKLEDGYGVIGINYKNVKAHRYAYEQLLGAIPKGLELDHLCRNRACVNPMHLEAVSRKVNQARGTAFSAINAQKTHCPKGHLLEGDNLDSYQLSKGWRWCKTCKNEWARAYAKKMYHARKNGSNQKV